MIGGDALNNMRMLFQEPDIALFVREKKKFFCARLRDIKERLGQQSAKFPPIGVSLIQVVKIFIGDEENFRILHRFNKIPTRVARYKTPERNDKLVLREKINILISFCIWVAIVDPENAFYYQPKIITNHLLHVEEIAFTHFSGFPKRLAIANIVIGQLGKIPQMLKNDIVFIGHLIINNCGLLHVKAATLIQHPLGAKFYLI